MSANDTEKLTREVVFDLLNSPRRRFVIHFLSTQQESIQLQSLADQVAAWEDGVPVDELTAEQKKRIYVSLYQTHVPKLVKVGLITFDKETGIVEITDRVAELTHYLADGREHRPWARYYLALAVGGLLLYLGVYLAGLIDTIGQVLGVLVTLALLVQATYHVLYLRRRTQSPLDTLIDE